MDTGPRMIHGIGYVQNIRPLTTQDVQELLSAAPPRVATRHGRRHESSTAHSFFDHLDQGYIRPTPYRRERAGAIDITEVLRERDEAAVALENERRQLENSFRETTRRMNEERSRRSEPDYVPTTRDQLLARTIAVFQNVRALQNRIAIEVEQRRRLHQSVPSGLELWLRWNHMVADIQHDQLCYYVDNFDDFWFDGDVCEPDIDLAEYFELDYSPADGEVDYACFLDPKTGEQLSDWFSVAQVENQMRRAQSRENRTRGRQGLRAHDVGFDIHLAVAAQLEALPGRSTRVTDVPIFEEIGEEVNDDGNGDEQGSEDIDDNEHQDAEGEFEESEDDDVEDSSELPDGMAEYLNTGPDDESEW